MQLIPYSISDGAECGEDHPHVAISLNNLASTYRDLGKLQEALPLYESALNIYEARLGKDHPHTQVARKNLAQL
ncbi:MAG: tetratricopeptide repeat protein, partial [Bacteroidota bacterium]